MILVYLLLSIFCIFSYLKHNYIQFIVGIFIILSSGCGFFPSISTKTDDFALVVVLCCFFFNIITHQPSIDKNDKIAKSIFILLSYYAIITLCTVLSNDESVLNSLLVFRFDLFYLSYFVFRRIPYSKIQVAVRYIFYLSTFAGVFYYLQFVGLTGVLNSESQWFRKDTMMRLTNTPMLTQVFLFYVLFDTKLKYRVFYILFYAGLIILPMSRGEIISTLLAIFLYALMTHRIELKKTFKFSLMIGVVLLLFSPILMYRFSNQGSTGGGLLQEISKSTDIITTNNYKQFDNSMSVIDDEGTFVFRILLCTERINYLSHNVLHLLFGEGTIHETTGVKKYKFNIGTPLYDGQQITIQMIDTNDISFISHIFRYGIVYLILFISLLITMFKSVIKRTDLLSVCCSLVLLTKFIQALGSDRFYTFNLMFFVLLVTSQAYKINNRS